MSPLWKKSLMESKFDTDYLLLKDYDQNEKLLEN